LKWRGKFLEIAKGEKTAGRTKKKIGLVQKKWGDGWTADPRPKKKKISKQQETNMRKVTTLRRYQGPTNRGRGKVATTIGIILGEGGGRKRKKNIKGPVSGRKKKEKGEDLWQMGGKTQKNCFRQVPQGNQPCPVYPKKRKLDRHKD